MGAKKLTVKGLKKKLRRIVNSVGDEYVYIAPTYEDEYGEIVTACECYYTDQTGAPSCLVGHLLAEVAPDKLRALHVKEWVEPDVAYNGPSCFAVYELAREHDGNKPPVVDLGDVFGPEEIRYLTRVQRAQDSGHSWGEALRIAKDIL